MTVKIEDIPDEDEVVRLLKENEIDKSEDGEIIPATHAFIDSELSTDWLARTTLSDCYKRLTKSTAHVIFGVGELRSVKELVQHDPTESNPAHTLVITQHPSGKRPKFGLLFLIHKMRRWARRPESNDAISKASSAA